MSTMLTLSALRALIGETGDALMRSVNDGRKVEPTHELILPRSDVKRDPWGAICDRLADFTADMSKRLDAGETALFSTNLKYQIAEYMRTMYPATAVRGWGFTIDRSAPPGAKTISISRLEVLGRMRRASSLSDDAPLTTLRASEDLVKPEEYVGAVDWSLSQLEAAAFAGFPLEMESLNGLALIAEQNFELVAASGDADANISGLLTEANIPGISPITGTWSGATHEQVLADLQKLLYTIRATTKGIGVLQPNLLVIPEALWRYLNLRSTYMHTTVRAELLAEFDGLRIVPWAMSDLADAAGTGPRILAACTQAQAGRIYEPLPFQLLAPQQQGMKFRAYGRQKLAGVGLQHPKAFGHMDGC